MNDHVGGHVDFFCEQSVSVTEQVKAGAIKAYAISAVQRLASLPDVPTAKEAGIDDDMSIWAGIFAPKGTPASAVARLADALDGGLEHRLPARDLGAYVGGARYCPSPVALIGPAHLAISVSTNFAR